MIARALVASPTPPAQLAAEELRTAYDWVPLEQAEQVVALGGDGFMLQTLHAMLERRRILPVFGMNLGTIGFLMNDWRLEGLEERLARAKPFRVSPLSMTATTVDGEQMRAPGDQRSLVAPRDPPDRQARSHHQRSRRAAKS